MKAFTRLRLIATIALISNCQSSHKSQRAKIPTLSNNENTLITSLETKKQLTNIFNFSDHKIKIELLNSSILEANFKDQISSNDLIPEEAINAELDYIESFFQTKQRCFLILGKKESIMEFWNQHRVITQTSPETDQRAISKSANSSMFCSTAPLSPDKGINLVITSKQNLKTTILEWSSDKFLSKSDIETMTNKPANEIHLPQNLDYFLQSGEQHEVIEKALDTHNLKYIKRFIPNSEINSLSPNDRLYLFSQFLRHAQNSESLCDTNISKHLISSGLINSNLKKILPLKDNSIVDEKHVKAFNCPLFAEYMYIWSPQHRDFITNHINLLFVNSLSKSSTRTPHEVLKIGALYKIILARLINDCQSGDTSQCVIAELYSNNFKKSQKRLSLFKAYEHKKQQEQILQLLEKFREQKASTSGTTPGLSI